MHLEQLQFDTAVGPRRCEVHGAHQLLHPALTSEDTPFELNNCYGKGSKENKQPSAASPHPKSKILYKSLAFKWLVVVLVIGVSA